MPLDPKDTQAIVNLNGLYAHYVDHGEAEKWADLFQPGGVWERANASQAGGERRGPILLTTRAAMIDFAQGVFKAQRGLTRHVGINLVIEGDGTRATGRSNIVLVDAREPPIRIAIVVDIDDEYQKTPQGWRFKRRTLHLMP